MTGALVALFVASLTNTIIGIALPTIAGDLGGQDKLAIVASAALLTMTVSTPLWGKTSDLYGRKPLFMVALAVFIVASIIAGVAPNMATLIVGRSLQGVGAAGILALSNALVADFAPPRERAKYTSYFGAAFDGSDGHSSSRRSASTPAQEERSAGAGAARQVSRCRCLRGQPRLEPGRWQDCLPPADADGTCAAAPCCRARG